MVLVPGTSEFVFEIHGVEIEGGDDIGVDPQYPWGRFPAPPSPIADRDAVVPVTNRQIAEFLKAATYRTADDRNFLKDWKDGRYPAGWEDRAVTWVFLEECPPYARWAGKRLPHEW